MNRYPLFALYLLIGEASVRILSFYANAFLGRTLGPESFGLIIVGSSFFLYSLLLSDLGLATLGLLETSKPGDKKSLSFSDIVNAKLCNSALSFLVLTLLLSVLYSGQNEKTVRTISIYFLLNLFFDALFIEWHFKGRRRFVPIVAARIAGTVAYVAGLHLYVTDPGDAVKVPLIFFITNMASVVILFVLLPTAPVSYRILFSLKKYLHTIKQSFPLGAGLFLNQVNVYLPPVILGKSGQMSDSGFFGAALKIILLFRILDNTFSTLFLSALPRLWHNDKENAKKTIRTILHCTLAAGFFISLMTAVSSTELITLIFGPAYTESAPLLSVLSWFFALTMTNTIFVYGLIGIEKKERYLRAAAAGFVLNGIVILALTFFYGACGAAIAVVAGELIFIVLCYHELRKTAPCGFYFSFVRICAVSAAAYAAAACAADTITVKYGVAVVVFVVLSIVTRVINGNDVAVLVQKWKKE